MKATVFIPARYQSSRLPGKPLALIHGKPMIQHVYERVSQAQGLKGVYVATDDFRIADTVHAFGGQCIMTSEEAKSGTDRIADAADQLELGDDELIVNIQGDQPLVNPASIEDVIAPFNEDYSGDFEMSTLVYKIVNPDEIKNPNDIKTVFDKNLYALYFSRATIPYARDNEHHDYYKHLGVYAYTRRFVEIFNRIPMGILEDYEKLEQLRVLEHGHKIKIVISQHDSPHVDLPEDIIAMERLMTKFKNQA